MRHTQIGPQAMVRGASIRGRLIPAALRTSVLLSCFYDRPVPIPVDRLPLQFRPLDTLADDEFETRDRSAAGMLQHLPSPPDVRGSVVPVCRR